MLIYFLNMKIGLIHTDSLGKSIGNGLARQNASTSSLKMNYSEPCSPGALSRAHMGSQ